jgi:hypothetical protein
MVLNIWFGNLNAPPPNAVHGLYDPAGSIVASKKNAGQVFL